MLSLDLNFDVSICILLYIKLPNKHRQTSSYGKNKNIRMTRISDDILLFKKF